MIRSGLYLLSTTALDGVEGGARGVLLLREGTLYGGDSFFYFLGTYSCFDGKWKGLMVSQEQTQAPNSRPMARKSRECRI